MILNDFACEFLMKFSLSGLLTFLLVLVQVITISYVKRKQDNSTEGALFFFSS